MTTTRTTLTYRRIVASTRHAFRIAREGSSVQGGRRVERVIVTIENDGIRGWGEAAPTPYYGQSNDTVEAAFERARPLLGNDLENIDAIVDRLLAELNDQRAAVAALDMALHDWLGKKRGQPLWKLFALDRSATPPTSFTIGIDTPELIAQKVEDAAPFEILKVKIGAGRDEESLAALRRHWPDKPIRVDANCGWDPTAIEDCVRAVVPFDLELIEQPVPAGQLDAVRRAREVSPIPIIADEDSIVPQDVERLAGSYDGINIKLSKCGGIREGRRMISLAREAGLKIMLGCMVETSLGVSAAAHLASLVDFVDLDGHLLLADDPFAGLELRAGVVLPGDAPGLGITERPAG